MSIKTPAQPSDRFINGVALATLGFGVGRWLATGEFPFDQISAAAIVLILGLSARKAV